MNIFCFFVCLFFSSQTRRRRGCAADCVRFLSNGFSSSHKGGYRETNSYPLVSILGRWRAPSKEPGYEVGSVNWNDNCEAKSEAKSPRPLRGLQVDFSLTRNVSYAVRQ